MQDSFSKTKVHLRLTVIKQRSAEVQSRRIGRLDKFQVCRIKYVSPTEPIQASKRRERNGLPFETLPAVFIDSERIYGLSQGSYPRLSWAVANLMKITPFSCTCSLDAQGKVLEMFTQIYIAYQTEPTPGRIKRISYVEDLRNLHHRCVRQIPVL